ncbi:MAG TPA: hypothetical protein VFQ91_19150 [Bryobacteraceae bacterium]|nr:hypothetical protein [Bryobacteraceae bacterium]
MTPRHSDLRDGAEVTKEVEGAVDLVEYNCPAEVSLFEISRNITKAWRQAGIPLAYRGKDRSGAPSVRFPRRRG